MTRPRTKLLWGVLLLLLCPVPACEGVSWSAEPASEWSVATASLDDVTDGLPNNASRGIMGDPAGNPSAGAFFNDGGNGDVRARTENFFENRLSDEAGRTGGEAGADPRPAERLMVYRGELAIDVPRPEEALDGLVARAQAIGGYLASRRDTTIVLRVPAAQFQAFFAETKALGRVLHEQITAQDVTEEHLDLGIRLENARKARERLVALLERATEMKDILAIEREITRLTGEIERMTGQLRFLEDKVALATVTVSLNAIEVATPDDEPRRERSRFSWIRRVGAEEVWRGF